MPHSEVIDYDLLVKNQNAEFNQYMDYYLQLIRLEASHRVLVVEDDPINCRFIEAAVNHFNPKIQCFSAATAKQALFILNSVPCDFVIADYFLEGDLTGLELCEEIQKNEAGIRCLIVSTLKFTQFRRIVQTSSAQPEFCEKPLSVTEIEKHLTHVFGEKDAH
jgi:DNA-binding NtrC family response regulator